ATTARRTSAPTSTCPSPDGCGAPERWRQLVAGSDPGIEAAEEGAYARVAEVHQSLGGGRGARLVWAVAEEHDVVVERQAAAAAAHFGQIHDDGARNRATFVPGELCAQIDDHRLARLAHQLAQLVHRDACDAQSLVQTLPFPP